MLDGSLESSNSLPLLPEEDTGLKEVKVTCPRSHAASWQSGDQTCPQWTKPRFSALEQGKGVTLKDAARGTDALAPEWQSQHRGMDCPMALRLRRDDRDRTQVRFRPAECAWMWSWSLGEIQSHSGVEGRAEA